MTNPSQPPSSSPISASMAKSTAPSGNNAAFDVEEPNNAAYLGEADSDDHFEADIEINPEAHRHKIDDVSFSGLHGQSGEGDEPIERERKPQEAIDAAQAAYLGEADSDDAHEADREINPEKYRHRIDDAGTSGMHGESGEGDEPIEKK